MVTIYTTSTCPFCHKAKEYLTEKNVAFTEINLTERPEEIEALVQKTGATGVPVVLINDETIIGFDKGKIDAALGK